MHCLQHVLAKKAFAVITGFGLVALATVLMICCVWRSALAAPSNTINFQARLMTGPGSVVPDGDYNVEFKLYNSASSSGSTQGSCSGDAACQWTETRTGGNKVHVVNGYLTVNLGSVTTLPAINWDQELWLTLNVGGTSAPSWDGEMAPRLKLTAVPYALMAGQLATTNGSFRSVVSFVQPTANRSILVPDESGTVCLQGSVNCGFVAGSSTDFIQNQNAGNQTANFRISGTGRANTSMMTPLLQPTVDGTTALKIQSTDSVVTALTIDTYNGQVVVGANTAAQERLDVVGNLQVRDAVSATKSYRLRTNGGALDFEGAGADLYLSVWSGAGYTGTQYNQITFKANGSNMDFARGFNVSNATAKVGLGGNVNPQYTLDSTGDINTSTQYRIAGTVICTATGCTPAAGSTNYIQNTTTLQSANFAVQAATSGSVAGVLQANAAGTGDILQLKNGAGTGVATFGYTGQVLLKNSTDSTTAFQVQNAAGVGILVVDTTNQRVAIGSVAPALKFEVQGGDAAVYNSGNNARLVLGDSSTTGQYGYLQWDSANDYFRIEKNGTNGVKINDNFVTIGNVFPSKPLIVANGTNALFEVGTTGQLQARTSTNSTTAFQMQNNAGDVYFNGDSTSMRVGIGDGLTAPEVTLDVRGAIQQTGIETSGTGATDNNKWTKLGSCTITAQYDQCLTTLSIIGGHDGSTGNNTQATVSVRVKQQNALGGAPYVNVTLNDTAEVITKSDIVAVTTVNTGSTTTVELYGRITNTFENWFYTPVMNTGGYGESTWNWTPFSAFAAALPGGTQTPARYGNLNANLFAVESTSTTAVKIQNAGAANTLFVADTQNLRVAIGQATAAYTLDVAGDVNTTTQYLIAGTAICTATGCTASSTSAIQNQNGSDQTANFRISGTGRANTSLQAPLLDTATGVALNIGTTNATAINLNKATAITGNLSQTTGTVSLAATGTLSLSATTTGSVTSTGALTLTSGAAATWSTSAGNLTIQAATTNTLALTTAGAGTVSLGATNATTINVGTGGSVTRAINIATGGTNTTIIGTTSAGSTAIRGGTSSTAVALTTGSGGKIAIGAEGTSAGINAALGSYGFVLQTTTDSNNALQIMSSGGTQIFNVSTATGTVIIGALSINYSGFDGSIDATLGALNLGTSNSGGINIGKATTTTTFGGGLVDLGTSGTVQGAGLATDCSGSYNKLLWSSSTKKFSCGTDRASYTATKSANQTVNASTAYVNATDMSFPVGANETWIFEAHLNFNTAATPDIKFDVTTPASSTCDLQKINVNGGIGGSKYTCSGGSKPDIVMDGTSAYDATDTVAGSVVTGANSGTVQVRFAQNTSNASNTVLYAGSWIIAYKVSGADVAEIYYAKDSSIEAGDIVSIDNTLQAGVKKTMHSYDGSAIGVVSTKPGLVLGEPSPSGGKPVLLALNGRVPVKVTTENGPVKAGDFLTPSATRPGYAMKATRAGYTVGQALGDFTSANPGTVMMFTRLGYFAGPTEGIQGDTSLQQLNVRQGATIDGALRAKGTLAVTNDSTAAFTVQNTLGNTTNLQVDTKRSIVYIGGTEADTSPTLLVVGRKSSAGDPKGTDGAIYYSRSKSAFRCFESGTWKNCTNGNGMSYNTLAGGTPTKVSQPAKDAILITPLYVPGRIVANELRAYLSDMDPSAAGGDIGIYNAKGQLVLSGGAGSIRSSNGLHIVAPHQQGQARILEPGQYFMAVTWSGSRGAAAAIKVPYAGIVKRSGTLAGGGMVLPRTVDLGRIAESAQVPSLSVDN